MRTQKLKKLLLVKCGWLIDFSNECALCAASDRLGPDINGTELYTRANIAGTRCYDHFGQFSVADLGIKVTRPSAACIPTLKYSES